MRDDLDGVTKRRGVSVDTTEGTRTVTKVRKVLGLAATATLTVVFASACSSDGLNLGEYAQSKGAEVTQMSEGYEYVGFGQEGDLQTVTSNVSAELAELGVVWTREPQCSDSECLREGDVEGDVLVLAVNKPSEGSSSVVTVTVVSQ